MLEFMEERKKSQEFVFKINTSHGKGLQQIIQSMQRNYRFRNIRTAT